MKTVFNEYDALANYYDLWASSDPASTATHDFYVDLCRQSKGVIVELGIGTGRIAIDVAKNGKNIIGVDISKLMLEKCHQKALDEGVVDYISLFNGDIRDFELRHKADLIIFPFRSIGHLLTPDSKLVALKNIYNQLASGGKFVFDHYIFYEPWARNHDGVPRLMYHGEISNLEKIYIWDTYKYDYSEQRMDCTITIEHASNNGVVDRRIHCPMAFSWIYPNQIRQIALDIGFDIEASYGDFSLNELNASSSDQIWILRKP